MLYRQRRPIAARFILAALARIVGFAAEFHRTGTDKAHLDLLNEHALRDLGIQRIATRDDIFYR
jgi:uncharacterized protein YjiS (DUF1127 family)